MKKNMHLPSKEDQETIISAVKKAENATSGEIVPMIVSQSSLYPAATFLSAFVYALAFSSLLTIMLMLTERSATAILHFFTTYFFENLASYFLFLILFLIFIPIFLVILKNAPELKKIFLSRKEIAEQVQETALSAFKIHGLDKTKKRNGLLIFVSLFEKRVTLIADTGISAHISQSEWKKITDELAQNIKRGNLVQGICGAIDACGKILAQHFPKERGDKDELQNIIVEK